MCFWLIFGGCDFVCSILVFTGVREVDAKLKFWAANAIWMPSWCHLFECWKKLDNDWPMGIHENPWGLDHFWVPKTSQTAHPMPRLLEGDLWPVSAYPTSNVNILHMIMILFVDMSYIYIYTFVYFWGDDSPYYITIIIHGSSSGRCETLKSLATLQFLKRLLFLQNLGRNWHGWGSKLRRS